MKRKLSLILVIILLMTLAYGLSSGADTSESIRVFRNLIKLDVNGQRVTMDNFLYNGRTYVPMREVAELLGKEVGWNAYSKTASIFDVKYEKTALSALLPSEIGYSWIYNGFAEYGHTMTLNSITDELTRRVYTITGEVDDMSDGESLISGALSIKYILTGNALIQEKTELRMLDSKFNRLTLIKTPLVAGTTWTETLTDKYGKSAKIDAIIKKVEIVDGTKKQYTVYYDDVNSAYFEERVIKEGVGVVSVEKLLELTDMSFPAGYFLYVSGMITELPITLYFPDSKADQVYPEIRSMMVIDGGVARAAVQGLIWGPQKAGLLASIPEGTRLLGISIKDGICTVDFSKEFVENHPGGSAGELVTLSSVIKTLTQFDTISKVRILVEGKTGATLGNILLGVPLD
ncbi:MAG: GerMN domain-containing protein [Erysipelotrichaceae bacterium]|nr:GerMN domain-containing protein [Erysipelotrichaceae bacterium]